MNSSKPIPKVVVIFPAKNEEGTIEHVISTAKKSQYKPKVIVVDAYSSDRTSELAQKAGGTVIQQEAQMFPAKGNAMKTGLKKAIELKSDIIMFLDADIKNLTSKWIDDLVEGSTNCDMVRGYYLRCARDAAVTKLIARPMLHIFFPDLSHFEQPLSGEVCARREVWEICCRKVPQMDRALTSGFLSKQLCQDTRLRKFFLVTRNIHLLKTIVKM